MGTVRTETIHVTVRSAEQESPSESFRLVGKYIACYLLVIVVAVDTNYIECIERDRCANNLQRPDSGQEIS